MPYEAIRVRDIADAVGCNHGLITQYFGSKLNLFTEVLHRLGLEIKTALDAGSVAPLTIASPYMTTYWRLLAALLANGLDPSIALNEGAPVIDAILDRSSRLAGRDMTDSRHIAAQVILMVGGYHVFGDVFLDYLSPDATRDGALTKIQETILMILEAATKRA